MSQDSDDDVRKIFEVIRKGPNYLSKRDLKEHKKYKIKSFEVVSTSEGERVRIALADESLKNGLGFVHLPERLLDVVSGMLKKFNELCKGKGSLCLVFLGLNGKAFDLRFRRC